MRGNPSRVSGAQFGELGGGDYFLVLVDEDGEEHEFVFDLDTFRALGHGVDDALALTLGDLEPDEP